MKDRVNGGIAQPAAVDEAVDPKITKITAAILEKCEKTEESLIQALQDIQRATGYVPAQAMKQVAEALDVPVARVYSVATFYKAFNLKPVGRKRLRVCLGTACHIRGGPEIMNELMRLLNIQPGETTEDGEYTLEAVNCVGACAMAPLVILDDEYHGNVKPHEVHKILEKG